MIHFRKSLIFFAFILQATSFSDCQYKENANPPGCYNTEGGAACQLDGYIGECGLITGDAQPFLQPQANDTNAEPVDDTPLATMATAVDGHRDLAEMAGEYLLNFSNGASSRTGGLNLRGAKFIGSFSFANFRYANLEGADFSSSDLVGADFRGAILRDAKFQQANLTTAKLSSTSQVQTTLNGADFSEAIVAYADFSYSSALRANFSNSIGEHACRSRFHSWHTSNTSPPAPCSSAASVASYT